MANDKATPFGEAIAVDVSGEKQGGKYCGCCCDYRRAVFVFAIIGVIASTINIITAVSTEDAEASPFGPIVNIIEIIVFCLSFYGALKYNVAALSVYIAVLAISFVFTAVMAIIFIADVPLEMLLGVIALNAFFTALAMYPSVFLIKEIKSGIMTEATYPREAHSCCCISKV